MVLNYGVSKDEDDMLLQRAIGSFQKLLKGQGFLGLRQGAHHNLEQ